MNVSVGIKVINKERGKAPFLSSLAGQKAAVFILVNY